MMQYHRMGLDTISKNKALNIPVKHYTLTLYPEQLKLTEIQCLELYKEVSHMIEAYLEVHENK